MVYQHNLADSWCFDDKPTLHVLAWERSDGTGAAWKGLSSNPSLSDGKWRPYRSRRRRGSSMKRRLALSITVRRAEFRRREDELGLLSSMVLGGRAGVCTASERGRFLTVHRSLAGASPLHSTESEKSMHVVTDSGRLLVGRRYICFYCAVLPLRPK